MDLKYFWLVNIGENYLNVSLATIQPELRVLSIGETIFWQLSENNLITAIDQSLTDALTKTDIDPEQEPEDSAFILPPYWIGSDGKIIPSHLKLIKDTCKQLKLKPMGFIAHDEAIVEEANLREGLPVSFILVHLDSHEMILTLVYLGKIKERIKKTFSNEFSPVLIESALLELKVDNTLPPLIYLFGQVSDALVNNIKNYPWVGRKDVETFLHFPDIKKLSFDQTVKIFAKIITSQVNPEIEEVQPDLEVQDLEEVDSDELGFAPETLDQPSPTPPLPTPVVPVMTFEQYNKEATQTSFSETPPKPKSKLSFKFPKLSKPKLPKFGVLLLALLALIPLLIFVPQLISQGQVIMFVTPYTFEESLTVTLDPQSTSMDVSNKIIPVKQKVFELESTASIDTTGTKLIGENAKGEITVFNKLDKVVEIPKGSVLSDSSDHKYTLDNTVQVPASTSDFEKGVITLGQTKTVITAQSIGAEYNIPKDTQLNFTDIPSTSITSKSNQPFSGGSSRQISAVAQSDRANLEAKIKQDIKDNLQQKIDKEINNVSGLINDSIKIKQNSIDYSREVGEEAEVLDGAVNASVTALILDPNIKTEIINKFLSDNSNFNDAQINPDDFDIQFQMSTTDSSSLSALMTISGKSPPKIDTQEIKKSIAGKSIRAATAYIKDNYVQAYGYQVKTTGPVPNITGLLPFSSKKINLEIKIE